MEHPGFDSLHEKVQRWIVRKGWESLRPLQERACVEFQSGDGDLILAAGTAAGKTEAAFLPICSKLIDGGREGLRALYVGPLKALINDQFSRLEELCRELDIEVHRWHGDVSSSHKERLLQSPSGILLITPESLEAIFTLHGTRLASMFAGLEYAVIDELHAFLGSERGRQLQSLLHRIECIAERDGRKLRRVGLSATLGDLSLASEFLRPEEPERVHVLEAAGSGSELKLQLNATLQPAPIAKSGQKTRADQDVEETEEQAPDLIELVDHLYRNMRGANHLIFTNSRADVELISSRLALRCEEDRVPLEFLPHHGSLSRELREDVESKLQNSSRPFSAVCTTTLEMGIDIGGVTSVAQIGPPSSVAGLRQRLGRSGRRGEAAILRMYVREKEAEVDTPLEIALHPQLLQSIAAVELLLEGWCEPPEASAQHYSTLIQQILSTIAERSGAKADELFALLCDRGPFAAVDKTRFARLLRDLGQADYITQMHDGTLVVGLAGERLVNHYEFFAAFASRSEYELRADGRRIGSMPLEQPLPVGSGLIFAGRVWNVLSVENGRRRIELQAGRSGMPISIRGGGGPPVHDKLRQAMLRALAGTERPTYLSSLAARLLDDARSRFSRSGLLENSTIQAENDCVVFPWRGDRVMNTLLLILSSLGHNVISSGIALRVRNIDAEELRVQVSNLLKQGLPSAMELAEQVADTRLDKHDDVLSEQLLHEGYASRRLDTNGAEEFLSEWVELG